MESTTITKSRDLALSDYYSILQLEYISYYVRSIIYPDRYAEKYNRYCIMKKEKIDKIGNKNGLPSIFNNKSVKDSYIEKFINPYGMPNFEYRDEDSIKMMGKWDKVYWFSEGVSVKIREDGNMVCTKVVKNIYDDNCIVAEVNGVMKKFGYEFISRIFSDKIIEF